MSWCIGGKPAGPTYTDAIEEGHRAAGEQMRTFRRWIKVVEQLAHQNQNKAGEKQKSLHNLNDGDTDNKMNEVERGSVM